MSPSKVHRVGMRLRYGIQETTLIRIITFQPRLLRVYSPFAHISWWWWLVREMEYESINPNHYISTKSKLKTQPNHGSFNFNQDVLRVYKYPPLMVVVSPSMIGMIGVRPKCTGNDTRLNREMKQKMSSRRIHLRSVRC